VSASSQSSRKILVIGGNSSLGREIISQAKQAGFAVHATARNSTEDQETGVEWHCLDLANEAIVNKFFQDLETLAFQHIIYCIGETSSLVGVDFSRDNLSEYFEVQFVMSFVVLSRLPRLMTTEVSSTLAFVSSRAAIYPSYDIPYAAVKGGLTSAMLSISKRLQKNQRAIVVAPGLIEDSKMFLDMSRELQADHRERAGGKLLSLNQAARYLLDFGSENSDVQNGVILEIGPRYK
jgi:NAD(P)-dependent dehydrogenase (short-subunit alcohol dehydrogenase family)